MVSFIIQGAKGTQSFPSFPFLFGWQRSAVGLNEQAVINNKACSGWVSGCCSGGKEGKWLHTRLLVCLGFPGKHHGVNRAACLLISPAMAAQGKLLHSSFYCWSSQCCFSQGWHSLTPCPAQLCCLCTLQMDERKVWEWVTTAVCVWLENCRWIVVIPL